MDAETARRLLGAAIQSDGSLEETYPNWIHWKQGPVIEIDGVFSSEYLEAVVWWMRKSAASVTSDHNDWRSPEGKTFP